MARWYVFGLSLGLLKPNLDIFEKNHMGAISSCLLEVIRFWLEGENGDFLLRPRNWDSLQAALLSIDENYVADCISKESKTQLYVMYYLYMYMVGPLYKNRSGEKLSDSYSTHELLRKGKSSFLLHKR